MSEQKFSHARAFVRDEEFYYLAYEDGKKLAELLLDRQPSGSTSYWMEYKDPWGAPLVLDISRVYLVTYMTEEEWIKGETWHQELTNKWKEIKGINSWDEED